MHDLLVALVAMLPAALAAALPDPYEDINITITFSDEDLGMPFAPITATCAGVYECPGADVCRYKRCASPGGRKEKAAAKEEDAAQAVFSPSSPPLTSPLHGCSGSAQCMKGYVCRENACELAPHRKAKRQCMGGLQRWRLC